MINPLPRPYTPYARSNGTPSASRPGARPTQAFASAIDGNANVSSRGLSFEGLSFERQQRNPDPGRNRFAVIGDAGTGDHSQHAVAAQLLNYQKLHPFNSVMVLGDNVYQNGEPRYFHERIFEPYGDLMKRGVKFFPVLGNHDVKNGFGNAQLAYWGVPPFYSFKLGDRESDVEFWALDTMMMTPGASSCYENNPIEVQQKAALQLAWLTQSLAQSRAAMKVVYGHYPLYSEGSESKAIRAYYQGSLEQKLGPILSQYGVDLYMAGHEHHYEKPKSVQGVSYLVSGAAGKLNPPEKGPRETPGIIKQNHFMLFDIAPQGLLYQSISAQGAILDSGFIPRKLSVFPAMAQARPMFSNVPDRTMPTPQNTGMPADPYQTSRLNLAG